MSNDGKALEKIVTEIERHLLGSGFTVTPNEKVYDDEGNQIAEFDISIQGKVGSTSFKWLIECRDRPSQGPASGAWIQQLAGRKQSYGFDKVIAVSTTGFSPGAKQDANRLNISLRDVKSSQEISEQFGTIDFRLVNKKLLLSKHIDLDFSGKEIFDKAKEIQQETGNLMQDLKVRVVGQINFLTIRDFIMRNLVDKMDIKSPEDTDEMPIVFNAKADMELMVSDQILRIKGFTMPVTIITSVYPATILTVKSYGEDGEIIGEEATVISEMEDNVVKTDVLITRKDDEIDVIQNSPHKMYSHDDTKNETLGTSSI